MRRAVFNRITLGLLVVLFVSDLYLPVDAQEKAGPRKFALVVGVKEYRPQQPLPALSYTENDADGLAAVLKEAGFQVTLMTQTAGKEKARFLPMAEYIRDELRALVERPFLKTDDVVLVALAGHGVQFDEEKDGKKVEKFFFCPMDADIGTKGDRQNNLIALDHLYEQLDGCEAGTRLMMVDACRNDPSRSSGLRSLNSVTRPKLAPPPGGTIAFFSCSANQRAIEDPDLKHGVFFHNVIHGLRGKADSSKDGRITANELSEYVAGHTYDYVRQKYGAQQTPELKGNLRGTVLLATIVPPANLPPKPETHINTDPIPMEVKTKVTVEQKARVKIVGPVMNVELMDNAGTVEGKALRTPAKLEMAFAKKHQFRISSISGRPRLTATLSLTISTPTPATRRFFEENEIEIRLMEEDVDTINRSKGLIKVMYLPDAKYASDAFDYQTNTQSAHATTSRRSLMAGADPVLEVVQTKARGTILGVLTFGTKSDID